MSTCIAIRQSLAVLGLAAIIACGPAANTDLEILSVAAADVDGATIGDRVPLRVQVRNNGNRPATVSAATVGDPSTGLIQKGPSLEIRRAVTETLSLDLPAQRPFLERCEFVATIFLAKPGDPPNLVRDLWTDAVQENHTREFRLPISRPEPTGLAVDQPIREVVDSKTATEYTLIRHYEMTAKVQPEGARWAARHFTLQTQTESGVSIELLGAELVGTQLISGTMRWQGARERRESVRQARIRFQYVDCADSQKDLLVEGLAVVLEPRR